MTQLCEQYCRLQRHWAIRQELVSMRNLFEIRFEDVWGGEKYIAPQKELLNQPNELETICHLRKKMTTTTLNIINYQSTKNLNFY